MKILISAYACESGRGGEGEIAWRMIQYLAERNEVWVITRANLRSTHENLFNAQPKPRGLHFVYFDLPWILRFYKRGKRFFLLYYYFWQLGSGFLARKLVAQENFDLCHHLTGGMDWMPSGLALCKGPLLWGPVGSEDTHPVILRKLGLMSRVKDGLRFMTRSVMRHVDPFVRFSGRRACVVLSHTPETMPPRLADKVTPFTQTGIENTPDMVRPKEDVRRTGPLRILFAGELKDWKGALFALNAALKYFERSACGAVLTVVGDGPLYGEMREVIAGHPEGYRVVMTGKVPMERLVTIMQESDLFLYPSFHHGLATVVLQAMLTGVPVVCIEGDATGRSVRNDAGITVALHIDRDPVADLADVIEKLANDEEHRQSLAVEGQRIARERYTYASLAGGIENVYRHIREAQS